MPWRRSDGTVGVPPILNSGGKHLDANGVEVKFEEPDPVEFDPAKFKRDDEKPVVPPVTKNELVGTFTDGSGTQVIPIEPGGDAGSPSGGVDVSALFQAIGSIFKFQLANQQSFAEIKASLQDISDRLKKFGF
jgi:hypothetical protein